LPFPKEKLKATYSSEDSSLVGDFYLPFLGSARNYDRAVGYFSSHSLTFAVQGLVDFARNGGKMRLIIGWPVSEEEYCAIKQRGFSKADIASLNLEIDTALRSGTTATAQFRLNLLSWLVRSDLLVIKMVVKQGGMFHEKLGILTDEEENRIVFQGSANETLNALDSDKNLESISVYPSWKPEIFADYGEEYQTRFERLWDDSAKKSKTIDLPSESYERIRQSYPSDSFPEGSECETCEIYEEEVAPRLPIKLGNSTYDLKEHQKMAIQSWSAAGQKGIFALATGAGKTITALHAAVRVYEARRKKNLKTCVIISVPYQVLAEQWEEVAHSFGFSPLLCYRNRHLWVSPLQTRISNLKLGLTDIVSLIVVDKTLKTYEFQKQLKSIDPTTVLFIGDECHHHHSIVDQLPNANMRIGLSATPWSRTENDRRDLLISYYGPIVASYTIDQALADGVLTPYNYLVHSCPMNLSETEEYVRLQKEIDKMLAIKMNGGQINEKALQIRHSARARLLGSVESKFTTLSNVIGKLQKTPQNLFYCGDGSVELEEQEKPTRNIVQVTRLLHDAGWRVSKFTADENRRERKDILSNFSNHEIDGMVAIRVLDEGVDLPGCHQAFLLASARNERQYIQRRGRVLRLASNKEEATIHDFIVLPPADENLKVSSKLVQEELRRAYEFLRVAQNNREVASWAKRLAENWGVDFEAIVTESKESREEKSNDR
jgi:superfamily II DNA or RNA helicase